MAAYRLACLPQCSRMVHSFPACLRPSRAAPLHLPALPQGVSFLGQSDEFVMSGSDCGHIFIWQRSTGAVQAMLKVGGHPAKLASPARVAVRSAGSGLLGWQLWLPKARACPFSLGSARRPTCQTT